MDAATVGVSPSKQPNGPSSPFAAPSNSCYGIPHGGTLGGSDPRRKRPVKPLTYGVTDDFFPVNGFGKTVGRYRRRFRE